MCGLMLHGCNTSSIVILFICQICFTDLMFRDEILPNLLDWGNIEILDCDRDSDKFPEVAHA